MFSCPVCIMNDSVKEFKMTKANICNFCDEWEKQKNSYINFTEDEIAQNLSKIKKKIFSIKNNSNYDCVIGLSGGTDSSFVVYQAWKLGLKPIIIHMDNGWNSKTSNHNISKILDKTNFDYKTLILDWEEFRNLQISFLKAGVPDIELITDHAIFAYIIDFAIKEEIKFILSGVNFATEHSTVNSWGWRKDDFNHIRKIHKKFGKKELKTFPKMYPFKKFYYEKIKKKINVINILDFINYNSSDAKQILKKEFNWECYGGKHQESFFTMFFQGYILPKKFKIDKRILHLSCMIRNKEITRERALEIISLPSISTQKISQYENFFKKKLQLSNEEFDKIMSDKPKHHSDYDIDIYDNLLFKLTKKVIKNLL
tara:strand:+ start:5571 stop:6680 length:1110 start_codon:yes stop_codon:yes gene_type:complete